MIMCQLNRFSQPVCCLIGELHKGDGERAAYHMLHMGRKQACPDPLGFTSEMVKLFKRIADINAPSGIDLDQVWQLSCG